MEGFSKKSPDIQKSIVADLYDKILVLASKRSARLILPEFTKLKKFCGSFFVRGEFSLSSNDKP
jgi:hypothetical protein